MLTLITSDRFADHLTPPGHPERHERAEVMQVVADAWRAEGGRVVEPRSATDAEILRVHRLHRSYTSFINIFKDIAPIYF